MGFRFRKSVQIAKGVRLNFSSRGVGVSVGGKGGSISVGPSGAWANASIPGTGISYRTRLDKPSSSRSSRGNRTRSGSGSAASRAHTSSGSTAPARTRTEATDYRIRINDDGSFSFFTHSGLPVTDEATIQRIKRSSTWPQVRDSLKDDFRTSNERRAMRINEAADVFADISKHCPRVLSHEALAARALRELAKPTFQRQPFPQEEPTPSDFARQAEEHARQQVKGLFKKRKRTEAAQAETQRLWQDAHDRWLADKTAFDAEQDAAQARAEAEHAQAAAAQRSILDQALAGDAATVERLVELWLANLELPFEASASFEIGAAPGHGTTPGAATSIMVDLDLPEIEDIPDEEATVLATGMLKVKNRTQTSARACYASCVFGLGMLVAANLFNLAPTVERILVSAYTQRRDRRGEVVDDYIYSVRFSRPEFEGADLTAVDPEEFVMRFENRCLLSKTKVFKTIEPYETA